jgi:hypothetical protein
MWGSVGGRELVWRVGLAVRLIELSGGMVGVRAVKPSPAVQIAGMKPLLNLNLIT